MAYPAETSDGVVTSWIALTSPWSSVQGCSDSYMLEGDRLVAFDPAYGISVNPRVRCQPNAVTTWWNQGNLGFAGNAGGTAVSLLPVICPDEWSTVATSIRSFSSTQLMCCPPGHLLKNADASATGVAGDCVSDISSGVVLPYASALSYNTNSYVLTSTTVKFDSTVGAIAVIGWNVQSTVPLTTTSPGKTSVASSSMALFSSTVSSTPTITTTETGTRHNDNNGGLSIDTQIEIGVGVAAGAIVIVSFFARIIILKRRNQRVTARAQASNGQSAQQYHSNLSEDLDPQKARELSSPSVQQREQQQEPHSYKAQQHIRLGPGELHHIDVHERTHFSDKREAVELAAT